MNATVTSQTQKAKGPRDISDTYFLMLNGLSPDKKLLLAERLIESVRNPRGAVRTTKEEFIPEKSAEELIAELRVARTFTREIEES